MAGFAMITRTRVVPLFTRRCFQTSTFSTASTKKSTSSRDTRLAGRLRFYKEVGIAPVEAPWEAAKEQAHVIESPISAGVDGTSSASGVTHLISGPEELEYILNPRLPGSTETTSLANKWFGVTLDGRTMKTPLGQTLAVPSETLAYAIAAEWDAQEKYLQPANMPLMTLACTTLDQVAHNPEGYRQQALKYLPTDTTCFWADPTEDRVLHRRQKEAWEGLHSFVKKRFDFEPAYAMGANEAILMARKRGDQKPFAGLPHPPALFDKTEEWTHTLDAWHLGALSSVCAQAKSFLVAFAVLEPDSPFREVAKAIEASRVEEEFQISNWGLVEGGHDYDRLNCSIQIHSAEFFTKSIEIDNEL